MKMQKLRSTVAALGSAALLGIVFSSAPVLAQGGGMRMMTPEQRVDSIDKAVTLTDDQKTKIKAIFEADRKKMQDMMASGEDRQTMMPKMRQMREDENTQVKALLTDDQKPKYDAYVEQMRQRRGGPGAGAPPPPPSSGDGSSQTPPPPPQQ